VTFAPEQSTAVSEDAACVDSVIIAGCSQQWGTAAVIIAIISSSVISIINCSLRYSE
jgi:hypothetical protein